MTYREAAFWFFAASFACTTVWVIGGSRVSKHRLDTDEYGQDERKNIEQISREWQ